MVLRLSALKYLLAAVSKGSDAGSGSCRQDTSACVCTSMAIRSFTFTTYSSSWGPTSFLVPVRKRTSFADQPHQQRRRLPVHGAEHLPVLFHSGQQNRQADGVCVEHRTAAIAREAVAGAPDHVDVAGALCDAFLEDAQPLVQQREDAAFLDFLVGMQALLDAELGGTLLQDLDGLRIVMPRAIAL